MFLIFWFGGGQVAIPVVPTVRVVITFTKFVELQPLEQFFTPFSSPRHLLGADDDDDDQQRPESHRSSSWTSSTWLRRNNSQSGSKQQRSLGAMDSDPFAIPAGYTWTNNKDDMSRKMNKSKSVRRSK